LFSKEKPLRELAFWANPSGYQQIKRQRASLGTPNIDISSREYFQDAIRQRTLSYGVPQVVRSATSTEKVLIVARPTYEDESKKQGDPTGVAAVQTSIEELERLVLPRGFQMSVLRADGTVMLHSTIDEHHEHNFFDDLSNTHELGELMQEGVPGEVDADYLGVSSRLHVERNRKSGWSVVTIASRGVVDRAVMGAVIAAVMGTCFLMLVVALIVVFACIWRSFKLGSGGGRGALVGRERRGARALRDRVRAFHSDDLAVRHVGCRRPLDRKMGPRSLAGIGSRSVPRQGG
jgi:hypothetical protein